MKATLYHYWLPPARWRRWSRLARWSVVITLAVALFALSLIPLLIWRREHAWQGLSGYQVLYYGELFFLIISLIAALAGATTIARERELGTWESLLLTPLGLKTIVRAKLVSRLILLGSLLALTLPFWLAWAYQVLEVNDSPDRPYYAHAHPSCALRITLYLVWLGLRIVGHALPFAALGLAVSAWCYQVRRALILTTWIVVPFCIALLCTNNLMALFTPQLPTTWIGCLFCWPLLPNDFMNFTATGLLSTLWRRDLLADVFWMLVLPYLFYRLALLGAGRSGKSTDTFLWERGVHGF